MTIESFQFIVRWQLFIIITTWTLEQLESSLGAFRVKEQFLESPGHMILEIHNVTVHVLLPTIKKQFLF